MKIPVRSKDCIHCHIYDEKALVLRRGDPCCNHPGGSDYSGPDVYKPSEWVLEVVGKRYRGPFGEGVFCCTGYDYRAGFWMQGIGNPDDLRNISERAIGRTFHRVYERS